VEFEIELKETESAKKNIKTNSIHIYLENYERFKYGKSSCTLNE